MTASVKLAFGRPGASLPDEAKGEAIMRPQSIELFEKVYLASIAISLVAVAVGWQRLTAESHARLATVSEGTVQGVLIGTAVLVFGIALLLWYYIARKARNVAKWVLVILTALGVYTTLKEIVFSTVPKDLYFAFNAASTLLGVYAVWLLFRPDAVAWLKSKGADGPGDPKTFD